MFKVYILFSATRNNYYIGFTGDEIAQRLRRHNSNHKGFTGSVPDWKVVWCEDGLTEVQAREKEMMIKGWKSRKMIERLIAATSGKEPKA